MHTFTFSVEVTEIRLVTIVAESESAARQAWIDHSVDEEEVTEWTSRVLEPGFIDEGSLSNAEMFGRLADELGASCDGEVSAIDYWMMVEENSRNGERIASAWKTVREALDYNENQEYASEWSVDAIVSLRTGKLFIDCANDELDAEDDESPCGSCGYPLIADRCENPLCLHYRNEG